MNMKEIIGENNSCFAIVGPPADADNLYQVLDWYRTGAKRYKSGKTLLKLFEWLPPYKAAAFPPMFSKAGVEVHGFHVMCPILPEMIYSIDRGTSLRKLSREKVRRSCAIAAENGAVIAGLGGFSSITVVGLEEEIAAETGISVTSGNTFTAWLTVSAVEKAAALIGIDMGKARVAMLGASGDIGSGACKVLCTRVSQMVLTARDFSYLEKFASSLRPMATARIEVTRSNREAVGNADIIIATAISPKPIIDSRDIRSGAVVCDVGYPKNINHGLGDRRDIFAFEGGLAHTPFEIDFGYSTTLPSKQVIWGCSAEAIILALEGRPENFSVGRGGITIEKMREIGEAGKRHGFTAAPFHSGKRILTSLDAERVRSFIRKDILAEDLAVSGSSRGF